MVESEHTGTASWGWQLGEVRVVSKRKRRQRARCRFRREAHV